jgi:GT2 family glycosyltransferase
MAMAGGGNGQVLVSVIVPACNAEATLERCLDACLGQTHEAVELIVVDDGSTDGTARIARGFPVHYVHQENRGPAAARNCGARVANGVFVAFTDADCVPAPDWVERLLTGFEEGVVAAGGTYGIANPDSLLARLVHEEIVARHERFDREVDFLGTFNVAYCTEAFEAAGGFDEDFTMASGEDNDLAYRLVDLGGMLRFAHDARVAHFHPTRLSRYLRTQVWHGFWRVRLYQKHPGRAGRGDRYAGPTDLLAPPLALAGTMGLVLSVLALPWPMVSAVCGGLALTTLLVCLTLRIPMAGRLARRAGMTEGALFPGLALLRDLARAAGMVRGTWHFGLRRKTTA